MFLALGVSPPGGALWGSGGGWTGATRLFIGPSDITYDVQIGTEGVSELQTATQAVGQADSGFGSFGETLGSMGGSAAGAVAAFGLVTDGLANARDIAIAAFVALREFGDEMERQTGILNRTEGSVRLASEAIGGLVSDIDRITSRNRLMQAGLHLTDEDFAAVAES